MVQKGKFSAAAWLFVNTLKKVDFLEIKNSSGVNPSESAGVQNLMGRWCDAETL